MRRPLPPLEIAIGHRLREFRENLNLSRPTLAARLRIPKDTLAAYEKGKAPVPWRVFTFLGAEFQLNPWWLFTADGHPLAPFDDAPFPVDDPQGRFSTVFAAHAPRSKPAGEKASPPDPAQLLCAAKALATQLEKLAATPVDTRRRIASDSRITAALVEIHTRAGSALSDAGAGLGKRMRSRPARAAAGAVSDPAREAPSVAGSSHGKEGNRGRSIVRKSAKKDNRGAPPPRQELTTLIGEVKRLTTGRGSRRQLAAALGVTPQRVSDWLSEKFVPDGLNLLRLQAFVREQLALGRRF